MNDRKKRAAAQTATRESEREETVSDPANEIKSVIESLTARLGDCVLIPVKPKEKAPAITGWQSLTIEATKRDDYWAAFSDESNIGVVLGSASGGLCTVDLDSDEAAEKFLEVNPALAGCLQTRGSRGRNVWVRVVGDFPEKANLTTETGSTPIGEWRSNRHQTIIWGVHPSGANYQIVVDGTPAEIPFGGIVWPEGWSAPFIETPEAAMDREFGPLFFAQKKGVALNHPGLIARFAAERDLVWEPAERRFYQYESRTGLWKPQTADFMKTAMSRFLLDLSVETDEQKLATVRTNGTLGALVDLLKGHVERYDPFSKTERGVVHVLNGMLDLRGAEPALATFHPDYRSRNQIPFAITDTAECPRFLSELLAPALPPDDISLLQRWAGAVLLGGVGDEGAELL